MGLEPLSHQAMGQKQQQLAQWGQGPQLKGAVSHTRGRTKAANIPEAADWDLHSDPGGELLPNHLPH